MREAKQPSPSIKLLLLAEPEGCGSSENQTLIHLAQPKHPPKTPPNKLSHIVDTLTFLMRTECWTDFLIHFKSWQDFKINLVSDGNSSIPFLSWLVRPLNLDSKTISKCLAPHIYASKKCPPHSSRTVSPEAWSAGKQPCRARSNHHYSYATRFKPSCRPRRDLYKCPTQPLWLCIYASLICKSATPSCVCTRPGKMKYHITLQNITKFVLCSQTHKWSKIILP